MSYAIQDDYDIHSNAMKNLGIDENLFFGFDSGILPLFKKELMPKVKALRNKIQMFDKFKCRSIDVAILFVDLLNCCIELSKSNSVIYDYIKSKVLNGKKV